MASNKMKEIAMIDHAEFSTFARIQSSTLLRPAYFARVSPDALETKIAGILIPDESPDTVILHGIISDAQT